MSAPGGIVWLTGLSGAGKTTLARAAIAELGSSVPTQLLDGDEIREHLSRGLGFSREDRDVNVQRIAYVGRLLATHGVLVFVSAIAPYADTRDDIRSRSLQAGHKFLEIFVNAPLATVVERDVKGLYRRALAGEIKHFTGIDDPYEAPTAPALTINTHEQSVEDGVGRLLAVLTREQLIGEGV